MSAGDLLITGLNVFPRHPLESGCRSAPSLLKRFDDLKVYLVESIGPKGRVSLQAKRDGCKGDTHIGSIDEVAHVTPWLKILSGYSKHEILTGWY